MTCKLAIVGTGGIAAFHVKAIEWLNQFESRDIKVVAAVNRTAESNRRAQDTFNILHTYQNIDQMVDTEKPDGILVAVSAENLYMVVSQLIPYGIPLLIEKPPGLTLSEGYNLVKLSEEYGTKVMIGLNRRFYSVVQKAKLLIAEKGGLIGMRMDGFERYRPYRESGFPEFKLENLLILNSIHCIDLIRYYIGDIRNVVSFSNLREDEPYNHRYAALIMSDNNVPVTYQAYFHSIGNWNYELYFEDGKISFNNLEEPVLHLRGEEPLKIEADTIDKEVKPGFVAQMVYFIERVVHGNDINFLNSISDGIKTLELVEKIAGTYIDSGKC
ncbi:Gfo/Idh/MocA family protein [Paenibacillus thalictri]|uniref:Gfo/Idh/MocA family oxidoreductase n=1 Tax=Paenibacillus thalictri TaxID=2527873 RepID=A0A4Q9DIF6_9BACL|nr:Gfo/Idh/MocA family oxidoreductase [Paenibacillus thalictri]TBL73014.1 Gfo/Idh/MocA family oxidoreductase [Paenibacillus thalictri]